MLWIAVNGFRVILRQPPDADASIDITHALFVQMLTGGAGASDILFSDDISIEGSKLGLVNFFALLDTPEASFNIVTP